MAKKLFDYTRKEIGQAIGVIICVLILLWVYGCESKVKPLNGSISKVSRSELTAQLELVIATANIRYAELDRQDELKQILFNNAIAYGQSGTINPFGVLTTLAGVLGIGATVDNVRKRKEIKKYTGP